MEPTFYWRLYLFLPGTATNVNDSKLVSFIIPAILLHNITVMAESWGRALEWGQLETPFDQLSSAWLVSFPDPPPKRVGGLKGGLRTRLALDQQMKSLKQFAMNVVVFKASKEGVSNVIE